MDYHGIAVPVRNRDDCLESVSHASKTHFRKAHWGKTEKTTAETSANVPESDVIEISEDGATVIEPEPAENFDGKGDVIAEARVELGFE